MRNSLNKSVLTKVEVSSALQPLQRKKKAENQRVVPLYQEIQMRYNEKREAEERERTRKLREHK